jgi:hypothetical protein
LAYAVEFDDATEKTEVPHILFRLGGYRASWRATIEGRSPPSCLTVG